MAVKESPKCSQEESIRWLQHISFIADKQIFAHVVHLFVVFTSSLFKIKVVSCFQHEHAEINNGDQHEQDHSSSGTTPLVLIFRSVTRRLGTIGCSLITGSRLVRSRPSADQLFGVERRKTGKPFLSFPSPHKLCTDAGAGRSQLKNNCA